MSKFAKLVTSPGVFFRDAFIKKYPLSVPDGKGKVLLEDKNRKSNAQSEKNSELRELDTAGLGVTFPVDMVFTWVDADDPDFIELFNRYAPVESQKSTLSNVARFKSLDELKYALRSIFEYAYWVNKVYIVTNGQAPSWLNQEHPKIRIVPHEEILDAKYLPTFNSHVIESAIHNIEGLSEHYIYFNDDMMLLRKIDPSYFFSGAGLGYMFSSKVNLPQTPINLAYDSATEWGAKNARRLIFDKYGLYVERMFAHTFYPQIKSVAELCEKTWPEAFDQCRRNRFRAPTDIFCTGFLFPHVAHLTGKAVFTKTRLFYFNVRKRVALDYYRMLKVKKNKDSIPFSMCPNDRSSEDGLDFPDYHVHLTNALSEFYDTPSPFEIIEKDSSIV